MNRRTVLALAAGAAAAGSPQTATSRPKRPISDIVLMAAAALAGAIHARKLSCVEVMSAYLEHIEAVNPRVNAIVALQEREGLMAQARERDRQLARGGSMGRL